MAERILYNLQKGIVDSTISTAAGLEKGSSYSGTYQVYHTTTNLHYIYQYITAKIQVA